MSDTLEVGKKLVDLCRQGKYLQAVDTLYAPNIVSIEPMSMGPIPQRIEGIDAVRKKNAWFIDNHEIKNEDIMGPFANGDRFVVHFKSTITAKTGPHAGQPTPMQEAAVYTVKDGKIVKDEFFSGEK